MFNVKSYLTNKTHQERLLILFIGLIFGLMLLVLLHTLRQIETLPLWRSLSQAFIFPALPTMKENAPTPMPTPGENVGHEWQDIKTLLASTPPRRYQALKKLGLAHGQYIIAAISIDCAECERTVLKLNQLPNLKPERIVAVAVAPKDVIEQWQAKLGLKYQVIGVSQELFEDLGAVILPTLRL